ncbi:Tyrosinase [Arthrobotrys entomopaga]|nr:Tyrosinase [Arthrobotrys entomopaga]
MKISTLFSAALLASAPFAEAAAMPKIPIDLDALEGRDRIVVRGAGVHHAEHLERMKKRSLNKRGETPGQTKSFLADLAGKLTTAAGKDQAKGIRGNARPSPDTVQVARYEIRQFKNSYRRSFELYMLALKRMQGRAMSDWNSYYSLAGIHGRPFLPRRGRTLPGTGPEGYCTHGSTLFPTWHRPYLAFFEEIVWLNAYQVIEQVVSTEAERQKWRPALEQLRIPYWDWATGDGSLPDMLASTSYTFLYYPNHNGGDPTSGVTVSNPLYSYKFFEASQNSPSSFGGFPWTARQNTLRYPTNDDRQPNPAGSSITNTNAVLRSAFSSVRSRVLQLLLGENDWAAFSNHNGNGGDSLESIHDTMHGNLGGPGVNSGSAGGHMTYVEYSSFDPVFFLHHCNVDRLFAIWQAIHFATSYSGTSNYVKQQVNQGGTYGIPPGTVDTINTPLWPFIQDNGSPYTSVQVQETAWFGYNYPEAQKYLSANRDPNAGNVFTTQKYSNNVKAKVQKLYGGTVSSSVSKRDVAKTSDPSLNSGLDKSLVNQNKYYEWRIELTTDKTALNGTYYIHFFLGRPGKRASKWTTQPNYVGDFVVFTHSMQVDPNADPSMIDNTIGGNVPLTDAMTKHFGANLTSLLPEDAAPFLIRNLRWRVTDASNVVHSARSIKGLNVSVAAALCTLPTAETPWTDYGEFVKVTDITRRIGTDGGSDNVGDSSSTTVASTSTSTAVSSSTATDAATTTYAVTSATDAPVTTDAPVASTDAPTTTAAATTENLVAASVSLAAPTSSSA